MATAPRSVESTSAEFGSFAQELVSQLHPHNGGFAQWHGYTDAKRLVLLADYMVQSVLGVGEALRDADLCALDHREALSADNFWVVQSMRAVATQDPGAPNETFLAAIQRDEHTSRRDRRIGTHAMHTLVHLVQSLDRLAAMVAIAAGVKSSVIRIGWGDLQRILDDGKQKSFEAPTSAGVAAQKQLLSTQADWPRFGPPDWLPWLLLTRNSTAHRAPTTTWHLTKVERKRMSGLVRPFYRQPGMSEMHSLAQGPQSGERGLEPLLILEESSEVLRGLIDSVSRFAAHVLAQTMNLWEQRRQDTHLIVQPGVQWNLKAPAALQFTGYGSKLNLQGGETPIHVGSQLARRLEASHVMDDNRGAFWA